MLFGEGLTKTRKKKREELFVVCFAFMVVFLATIVQGLLQLQLLLR